MAAHIGDGENPSSCP